MTGWGSLLLLIAASMAGLWALGVRGVFGWAAAAALALGAAGHAVTSGPAPAEAAPAGRAARGTAALTDARHAFFGAFTSAETWLRMSDALARTGRSEDSVNILQNAVRRYPGDAQLWTALGNALVDHGHGLTPAADYAFRRAAELAPGYPGPRYFHALALARSGNRAAAAAIWRDILAVAPAEASWRPLVERALTANSAPR